MDLNKPKPPEIAQKFLRWFLRHELAEEVEGDLEERFYTLLEKRSLSRAKLDYWYQVLHYLRSFALRKDLFNLVNPFFMFRHNFIISLRNLKRRKSYTGINILGLGLGVACALLIFSFVRFHLSFDTFHAKADRVYRIITEFHMERISYNSGVPSPLGEAFRNDFTIAEEVARVAGLWNLTVSLPLAPGDKKFKEAVAFTEPAFFDILDLPLVNGDKSSVLREPYTAVVTERIAKKYFGNEDPIGQSIRLDNKLDFTIAGILQDLPANTDRRQEIYVPFMNLQDHSPWMVEKDWWFSVNRDMQCFIAVSPNVTPATIRSALDELSQKYYPEENAGMFQFKPQALSDIHFNTDLDGFIKKSHLWALVLIGIFLIITSCFNFINLATAQAVNRAKEIGIKKVLGGRRRQLFWQFLAETSIITLLAVGLGTLMAYGSLPYFNQLFDQQIRIGIFQDLGTLAFLGSLLLVIIALAGFYPALVLTGIRPNLAIKGKIIQRQTGRFSVRRGLVITQFMITQVLLIGTIVIANQMRYVGQATLGFEKEARVMIPLPKPGLPNMETFKDQISQLAGVEKITLCGAAPAAEVTPSSYFRFDSRTEAEPFGIARKFGDNHYVSTFGLEIIEGRNLLPSDTTREYLVNETVVKKLGLDNNDGVIGRKATIDGVEGTIVGVMRDFHTQSLHAPIGPVSLTTQNQKYSQVAIKVNLANLPAILSSLEEAWDEFYPNEVYEYHFLDEQIARFYEQDQLMLHLVQVFAAIAIVIGCIGLYGLIAFLVLQKTKEVGIRKVLGASLANLLWQFGKEFTYLLLIAFVVAGPLAWWVMHNWLENFAYRVSIRPEVFLLTILLTLTITFLTIGHRSFRAASVNPVDSLHSE
jgi:putative ABC transport system permease protein